MESKFKLIQRATSTYEYSAGIKLNNPAISAGVTGNFSNRKTLKEATIAFLYENQTLASTHGSVKTVSNKDKDVHYVALELAYPM